MTSVDRRRVDERLERVERACRRLDHVAAVPLEMFLGDDDFGPHREPRIEPGRITGTC